MRRSVIINFKDGTTKELELSKATAIRSEDIGMLHLDKLPNGTWRLIFSDDLAKDFSVIDSFTMLRED